MKGLRFFNKRRDTRRAMHNALLVGITNAEYAHIIDSLSEAYAEACARQKPGTKKPSGFMRGMRCAIQIVTSIKPHNMNGGI